MKNILTRRILPAFIALLMISVSLVSCVTGDPDTNDTSATEGQQTSDEGTVVDTTTVEDVETSVTPDNLPNVTFERDGKPYKFNVLTRGTSSATWYSRDIYSAGITGDTIGDAVFKRNSEIEEKYKFEVVEIATTNPGNAYQDLVASSEANDGNYDMVSLRLKDHMTKLMVDGYLTNLNDVELMNLSKPYYDQNSIENLSISDKLFMVTGDLLTMDNDATRCVIFNKSMYSTLKIDEIVGGSLYELVANKTWTFDNMIKCAEAATNDSNGDGVMDISDNWGMVSEQFMVVVFLNGSGNMLFTKNDEDIPEFIKDSNYQRCVNVLEKAIEMINGSYTRFYSNTYTEVLDPFQEGKILFYPAQLADVRLVRERNFKCGIVPIPKYNTKQANYYCTVTAYGSNCISIPHYADNLERTAIIIEELSCKSMYVVTPAYREVCLKGRYFDDEESGEMLDIILNNTVFELGYMWQWGDVYSQLTAAVKNNDGSIASKLEKVAIAAPNAVAQTVQKVNAIQ